MDRQLDITIAEITTRFSLDSESLHEKLADRYESFLADAAPDIRFTVETRPRDAEGLADGKALGEEPRLRVEAGHALLQRGDFQGRFNADTGEGTLTVCDSIYSFDAFYRVLYTYLVHRRGGFLLHASAVKRKENGYIFTGASGSGKSTISGLSSENRLLSDELAVVMRTGDTYTVHGNPFWGDFQKGTVRESAPVKQLFFLRKSRDNHIDRIPTGKKIKDLLGNVLFFGRDVDQSDALLAVCLEFLTRVPAAELHFVPDESVWRYIDNA